MAARRTPKKDARRVGIYVRISRDRENEVSTDVQKAACSKYAREREWQIVEVFPDVGRGGMRFSTDSSGERFNTNTSALRVEVRGVPHIRFGAAAYVIEGASS